MTEQKIKTEQGVDNEKKKSNGALIIVNVIALLVIGGMAAYYFFFFEKEESVPDRGFAAQDVTADDFCEQWEERQASRGDLKSLESGDLPADFQGKIGGQNNLMAEICEDGKVTEEEEKELEEMRSSLGGMRK